MDIYESMIEQLWIENKGLLAMLGVPSLASSRKGAIPGNLCRDGARAIKKLIDQNEALRENVSQRFPGKNIDTCLYA